LWPLSSNQCSWVGASTLLEDAIAEDAIAEDAIAEDAIAKETTLGMSAESSYSSKRLPAPQYSSLSPGQINEQSESGASIEVAARVLPQ
jgi:hypothetical protein